MMRVVTVETSEEMAVVGHLRGWCHDGNACAICLVERRASSAEQTLDRIISG